MHKLIAESLTGTPTGGNRTDWMDRGTELEPDARRLYEFITDTEVKTVGLVYKDDRKLVAASPDGLVGAGGVEFKCPAPHTHVEYMLRGTIPAKYVPQVQGCMYITDLGHWDFMSYHPDMEPVLVRVYRDEEFIKALDEQMDKFITKLHVAREQLKAA